MPSLKPSAGAAGGHWSDEETSALIDAWAPLFLRFNRGRLPGKEWRLVASAVNAQRAAAGRRFNRTHVQCQKRVYNLMAQYKKELAKPGPSQWRHFARLRAFLAGADGPPPGFIAKAGVAATAPARSARLHAFPASVKKEKEAEEEVVVIGGASRAAGAGSSAAAVVTRLAEVFERVEMARLDVEKVEMQMKMMTIA